MINACLILKITADPSIPTAHLVISSTSTSKQVVSGQFFPIPEESNAEIFFRVFDADSLLWGEAKINPSEIEQNKLHSIQLYSNQNIENAALTVLLTSISKELFTCFCDSNNQIREEIEILQKNMHLILESSQNCEREASLLFRQNTYLTEQLKAAHTENEILKANLHLLKAGKSEEIEEKGLLVKENLSYQQEIHELHSALWEKEKTYKESVLEKEKAILAVLAENEALKTNFKVLEDSLMTYKSELELAQHQINTLENRLKAFTEVDLTIPANKTTELAQITNIQDILNTQCLSMCKIDQQQFIVKSALFPKQEAKIKVQSIDDRFLEYLKAYNVENQFNKIGDELYAYGNKRVSVSIKNEYLVCRVGGGYMAIDDFLKGFLAKQADFEGKMFSSPCKREKTGKNCLDSSVLKENMNTPSPKRLRIPSASKSSSKATTPLFSKLLYKS
jgi:hypothetical protein